MCRAVAEGGRRCLHQGAAAARRGRRHRAAARARVELAAAGDGQSKSVYQQTLDAGAFVYWSTGRIQADLDAEADRAYARRRHDAFLRSLGLDESGADQSVIALRSRRLHDADPDDPSRAWVTEALAANAEAERVWVENGATLDDLYENTRRGFEHERPDEQADTATEFVLGSLALQR